MNSADSKIQKNLHDISNALHNAYETLENVELSMDSDPKFCVKAIRATKEERDLAFQSISQLKLQLRELGIYG